MFGLTPIEVASIEKGPRRLAMALAILRFVSTQRDGATCDECMEALGFAHGSASVRYSELISVGCLQSADMKRSTVHGGTAVVHRVAPGADFRRYINAPLKRPKTQPGLSPLEQSVLDEGKRFLLRWKQAKTPKGRENAAVHLVDGLAKLARQDG